MLSTLRLGLAFVLASCVAIPGCSLTGLERFRFPRCGECETLNVRDGIPDTECMRWQCDTQRRDCTFGLRDADGDGYAARTCPGGDDCDDTSDLAFPGGDEACNAIDDDCNGLVDDVAATEVAPVVVIADVGTPTFTAYAPLPDGIGVAWQRDDTAAFALVTRGTEPATASGALGLRTNEDPSAALTSVDTQEGYPVEAETSLAPFPCDAGGTCTGGLRCVDAGGESICEAAVVNTGPPIPPGECLTHAECQDALSCNGRETCEPRSMLADARGCRARMPPPDPDPCASMPGAFCDEARDACISFPVEEAAPFRDLAVARLSAEEWLAVPLVRNCPEGAVRPGLLDVTEGQPSVLFRGDGRLSPVWLGVDPAPNRCTGGSRTPVQLGAAGIAAAGLEADPARGRSLATALAAWRAAPSCTGVGACAAVPSASVEVMGLWLENGTAGSEPMSWISGTGDGMDGTTDELPVTLPDDAASQRVDVASWESDTSAGWVVAYARVGGGVAVTFVDALPAPADPCPTMDPQPDVCTNGLLTVVRLAEGEPRQMPELAIGGAMAFAPTSMPVGDVAVAAYPEGRTISIALAWATATEVVLARGTYDPGTDAIVEGTPITWPATGASDVSVVHAAAGIATPMSTVEGVAITTANAGGLVVTWSSAAGTFAARVSDATQGEVGAGAAHIGPTSESPRAFLDTDELGGARVRVIARQGSAFVSLLACGS